MWQAPGREVTTSWSRGLFPKLLGRFQAAPELMDFTDGLEELLAPRIPLIWSPC